MLPSEIKLTNHARQRLEERNTIHNYYNTKNLMRSSVKWYGKDDLMHDCALYRHSCYTTRKSNQLAYVTDGDIEVIYNKDTKTAITVLEVKDKFKPITQYIKPTVLKKIEKKKEDKKKMKEVTNIGTCPDCGKENVEVMTRGMYAGLCHFCKGRYWNAKSRSKEYIPYLKLSKEEKERVDTRILAAQKAKETKKQKEEALIIPEVQKTIKIVENYYQVKAEQNPAIAEVKEIPIVKINKDTFDPLSDRDGFIKILKDSGCEIPEESLSYTLNTLMSTDKLKKIFINIMKNNNDQILINLEETLNTTEKKLQYDWEYNGFQEVDDLKFKGFLTWKHVLKDAILFWKKLYQTNVITEMQKALDIQVEEPNNETTIKKDEVMKAYQVTTDSISTIYNTRRPFSRVFYATNEDMAYDMFKQWMAEKSLHEDPKKTTIIELKK